jgi:hypothetical protein
MRIRRTLRSRRRREWLSKLAEPALIKPHLSLLFRRWRRPNHLSPLFNFSELIDSLRLPPLEHLELLLLLAHGEDPDDWRTKYWLDASAQGRWVTPFAKVATRVARNAGADALELLRARLRDQEPEASVARALIFEAALATPDAALHLIWSWPDEPRESLLSDLAVRHPVEVAKLLASLRDEGALSADEAANRLWELSCSMLAPWPDPPIRTSRESALGAIDDLARTLLLCVNEPRLRAKLILCRLRRTEASAFQDELYAIYEHIEPYDLWPAISVSGPHQLEMLRRVVNDAIVGGPHRDALSRIDPAAVSAELWSEFATLLDAMLDHGSEEEVVACAADHEEA